MFCSRCGSDINEGEKFCAKCGAELIYNEGDHPDYLYDEVIDNHYDSASTESMEKANDLEEKRKTSSKIAGIILGVLLVCVAAALIAIAAMKSCSFQPAQDVFNQANDTQVLADNVSAADVEEMTTTAEPTTTTTTTVMTTTTTAAKDAECNVIRSLLTSKKWKTTLEGYNADIEFKENGTANITVKVPVLGMSVKKTIEADYSLNDDCVFKISAEFGGKTYGINGIMTRDSDKQLTVTRPNNAGTVTITAA